ncbi:MAG: hypothetical protein ACREJO_00655 [Phycisphaerales bacterium]
MIVVAGNWLHGSELAPKYVNTLPLETEMLPPWSSDAYPSVVTLLPKKIVPPALNWPDKVEEGVVSNRSVA